MLDTERQTGQGRSWGPREVIGICREEVCHVLLGTLAGCENYTGKNRPMRAKSTRFTKILHNEVHGSLPRGIKTQVSGQSGQLLHLLDKETMDL